MGKGLLAMCMLIASIVTGSAGNVFESGSVF